MEPEEQKKNVLYFVGRDGAAVPLGEKCFDEIMEKINCIRDTEYSELLRKLREDWTGNREEAARAIEDLQARLKEAEKYRKEADSAKALVDRIYREVKIAIEHNVRLYGDWFATEIEKWRTENDAERKAY